MPGDKPKPVYRVAADDEEPAGASSSDEDKGRAGGDALSQVDLTMPLRPDEVMPHRTHHVVKDEKAKKPKKKKEEGKAKAAKKGREAAETAAGGEDGSGKKAKKEKKEKKGKKEVAPAEGIAGTDVLASPVFGSLPTSPGVSGKLAAVSLEEVQFGKAGDSVALSEPYDFVLHTDKVVKVGGAPVSTGRVARGCQPPLSCSARRSSTRSRHRWRSHPRRRRWRL